MIKLDIKIVGSVTDETELDQIQSIAKVFVYEQRMKCFKYPTQENNPIRKRYFKHHKKTDDFTKIVTSPSPIIRVRGLF